MKIISVETYITEDGMEFKDYDEATVHEQECRIAKMLREEFGEERHPTISSVSRVIVAHGRKVASILGYIED